MEWFLTMKQALQELQMMTLDMEDACAKLRVFLAVLVRRFQSLTKLLWGNIRMRLVSISGRLL